MMEDVSEDKQVVDLLTKLKDANGPYPAEMLAARRKAYQQQVANIGLGLGIGTGIKHIVKGGGNSSGLAATVTGKVLETALIAAITIEAGTATYLYRDKIADAVKSYLSKPTAQEVASSASNDENLANPKTVPVTPTVTPSVEPSATPSGSPSPMYTGTTTGNNTNGNNGGSSVNATPDPGGNNGNQYGLTPKPERTKDTGGGSSNSGGNNTGGGNNNNGGGNKKP